MPEKKRAQRNADEVLEHLCEQLHDRGMRVDEFFALADKNGSSYLSKPELGSALKKIGAKVTDHELCLLMGYADENNDHKLSVKEVSRAIARKNIELVSSPNPEHESLPRNCPDVTKSRHADRVVWAVVTALTKRNMTIMDFLRRADTNCNKRLQKRELQKAFESIGLQLSSRDVDDLIEVLSSEGKSYLSYSEFGKALDSAAKARAVLNEPAVTETSTSQREDNTPGEALTFQIDDEELANSPGELLEAKVFDELRQRGVDEATISTLHVFKYEGSSNAAMFGGTQHQMDQIRVILEDDISYRLEDGFSPYEIWGAPRWAARRSEEVIQPQAKQWASTDSSWDWESKCWPSLDAPAIAACARASADWLEHVRPSAKQSLSTASGGERMAKCEPQLDVPAGVCARASAGQLERVQTRTKQSVSTTTAVDCAVHCGPVRAASQAAPAQCPAGQFQIVESLARLPASTMTKVSSARHRRHIPGAPSASFAHASAAQLENVVQEIGSLDRNGQTSFTVGAFRRPSCGSLFGFDDSDSLEDQSPSVACAPHSPGESTYPTDKERTLQYVLHMWREREASDAAGEASPLRLIEREADRDSPSAPALSCVDAAFDLSPGQLRKGPTYSMEQFQRRSANLKARYPNMTDEQVASALRAAGGHVGMASERLQKESDATASARTASKQSKPNITRKRPGRATVQARALEEASVTDFSVQGHAYGAMLGDYTSVASSRSTSAEPPRYCWDGSFWRESVIRSDGVSESLSDTLSKVASNLSTPDIGAFFGSLKSQHEVTGGRGAMYRDLHDAVNDAVIRAADRVSEALEQDVFSEPAPLSNDSGGRCNLLAGSGFGQRNSLCIDHRLMPDPFNNRIAAAEGIARPGTQRNCTNLRKPSSSDSIAASLAKLQKTYTQAIEETWRPKEPWRQNLRYKRAARTGA